MAIHGETAEEVIYHRADSEKQHMGLQTWKDAPNGKIQRFDVTVAKNYLTEQELSAMARIVNAYLDLAEMRAEEQVPMTMEDWAEQFEGLLKLSKKEILTHAGSISTKIAEAHALNEFEKYRVKQDQLAFIYCSTYGRPRTSNYLGKQLHDFVLNHDVPYVNWRILRYTYATTILKAGYSLQAVSKTLGHTKKEFTADYYVDMKELIRDFQPSVEIKTRNEKKAIWEWSLTEEMERLLE